MSDTIAILGGTGDLGGGLGDGAERRHQPYRECFGGRGRHHQPVGDDRQRYL